MARASREADGRQGSRPWPPRLVSLPPSKREAAPRRPGRTRTGQRHCRLSAGCCNAASGGSVGLRSCASRAAQPPRSGPREPRSRAGREARTLSCPGGPQSQCGVCAAIHPLILRLCPRRAVSLTTSLMRRGKGGDQGKDAATARQTVGGARCGN